MQAAALDDPNLVDLTVSRVELSRDKSFCTIFIYTTGGVEKFNQILDFLKAYKPSLRKALSQKITGRYIPDLAFKFDHKFEQQQTIELLLDQISTTDDQDDLE